MAALALLAAAALLPAANTFAPTDLRDAEQLRCAAAFSVLDAQQQRSDPSALARPPMRPDGVEFFVTVIGARMDRDQLTEEQVTALVTEAIRQLQADSAGELVPGAHFAAVIDRCLPALQPAAAEPVAARKE